METITMSDAENKTYTERDHSVDCDAGDPINQTFCEKCNQEWEKGVPKITNMKKTIKHKIRKGSVFQIINDKTHPRNNRPSDGYYIFIFLVGKRSNKKIEKDIINFVVDNQNKYGQYALIHDSIDMALAPVMLSKSHPCLIHINADGVKRFYNKKSTDTFWKGIERLIITHRTNQRTIIITANDIPCHHVQQNADFIFAPKNMKLTKNKWIHSKVTKY